MENYCKSFEVEEFLRFQGTWKGDDTKVPLVTFTPQNMTALDCSAISKEDSLVRPVISRMDNRGVEAVPWGLIQAQKPEHIPDAIVLAGKPTNLNEINRDTTQFATYRAFLDPDNMPKIQAEIENELRFCMVQDDRLLPHPPAMEHKFPVDFVGPQQEMPDLFDIQGRPTRFDHVLTCTQ